MTPFQKRIRGIIPAILTALDEKFAVDPQAMRRSARRLLDNDCQGVVVVGTSPVGLPNVAGPPMVPRVIRVCMELVMLYATITNYSNGLYDGVPRATFFGLTAAAAAVPQLIGAKHRAAGWEQHGYTKGE